VQPTGATYGSGDTAVLVGGLLSKYHTEMLQLSSEGTVTMDALYGVTMRYAQDIIKAVGK
jgi:hypothetical protein